MSDPRVESLLARLRSLPGAVVAFSGGVDSSMLLHAALRSLGRQRVLAVTARSPSLPRAELDDAVRVASEIGARHEVIDTGELERDGYRANGPDRCYFCKDELFATVAVRLRPECVDRSWPILYGAIVDDLGDHRPGARAAHEHGVLAPLAECGFDKGAVRAYSRAHGLSTADKPAMACLSSRVPYHTKIDAALLGRVERAEAVLKERGFHQCRVRHHSDVARIEVPPADMPRVVALGAEIAAALRAIGYTYVAVDLLGYRTGALNEVL